MDKPIAWYDPTNGAVSTDKDSPLFTPLGQLLPLYTQQEQEPVAWISPKELLVMRGNAYAGAKDWRVNLGLEPEEGDVGLYTIPLQRTWVGLTRIELIKCGVLPFGMSYQLYEAIEAKLKEKNNG
jgi:hypothetical protein